jgi:hypothetical protein
VVDSGSEYVLMLQIRGPQLFCVLCVLFLCFGLLMALADSPDYGVIVSPTVITGGN